MISHLSTRFRLIVGMAVVAAAVTASVSTASSGTECSIDGMSDAQGLGLQSDSTDVAQAAVDTARVLALEEFPGTTIVELRASVVHAPQVPLVDGRRGIVVRLDNVDAPFVGGPIGADVKPLRVKCLVAVYEAETGNFMFSVRTFEEAR